jgi:hypothetical protein
MAAAARRNCEKCILKGKKPAQQGTSDWNSKERQRKNGFREMRNLEELGAESRA